MSHRRLLVFVSYLVGEEPEDFDVGKLEVVALAEVVFLHASTDFLTAWLGHL